MIGGISTHQGSEPAFRARAVTKSDTVDIYLGGPPCKRIYVGGTGNVSVLLADDADPVLYESVPAGVYLQVNARRVMSTNTTATKMIAEY